MKLQYFKFFLLNFYLIIIFSSAYTKYGFFNDNFLFFASILTSSILLIFLEYKRFPVISRSITVLIIVLYASFFINSIAYNKFSTDIFFSIIMQMGLGLALFSNKSRIIFIAFSSLLFYQTLSFFINSNDLIDLMVYSRNTISVYAIASFSMLCIAHHNKSLKHSKNTRNEIILMAILTLVTCIFSVGRSGIVASFILLIFVFLEYVKVRKLVVIITSLIVVLAGISSDFLIDYFNQIFLYTKFGIEGIETARYEMYQSYLDVLNFKSLIFGKSANDVQLIFIEEGYHNSYILLHMYLGIGVFIIFHMIYFTARIFFKSNNLILLGCLLAISIRAFTDEHLIRGNYLQFGIIISLYCIALSIKKQFLKNKKLIATKT